MVKPMDLSQSSKDDEIFSTPVHSLTTLFPFDMKINKLIIQHLTGDDFLKLSEVSTSFSGYVNNYQMHKIRLLIHESGLRKLDVEALLSSKRQYQHIKITRLEYAHLAIPDLFRRFAHSLVSIYTAYDFLMEEVHLMSVETLIMVHLEGSSGYYEHGLLGTVANLKSLQLQGRHPFQAELVNCLQNNSSSLEELVLEKNAQDSFFNIRRIPKLQLKSFKLDASAFEGSVSMNFEKFLAGLNTLKEIKILKCSYNMLDRICNNSVFSVERVTFSPSEPIRDFLPYGFEFHRNENITYMGLVLVKETLLRELLPKLPRLTTLYLSDPTPSMFKYIITNAPNLKEFRYAYFREAFYDIDLVRAIYQNEASKHLPNVPEDLIITQI